MGYPTPYPTVAEFIVFLQGTAGFPASYLPSTSPYITYAFDNALDFVNPVINVVGGVPGSWSVYSQAIFNYGADWLINYAPDQAYPIAAATWSGGLVTITTTVANAISPGDNLLISGISPNTYNTPFRSRTQVYAVANATTFQYGLALATGGSSNPGPATVGAGAMATEQFFADLRRDFKISAFAPGVIASTSDLTTSAAIDNPEFFKNLTLSDLQMLKTPFGRAYLAIAMAYGTIWGLT